MPLATSISACRPNSGTASFARLAFSNGKPAPGRQPCDLTIEHQMNLPTSAQVNTALRYAGTAVGAVASLAAFMGGLSQDQAATLVADVHAVIDNLARLFGDTSKLVLF